MLLSDNQVSDPKQAQGEKVLLAGDDVSVRRLAHKIPAILGFRTIEPCYGEQSMFLLCEVYQPDAVLGDYQMGGMSGTELTMQIVTLRRRPTITVLSGSPIKDERAATSRMDF
jgi:CheY-like chemotaxis protein